MKEEGIIWTSSEKDKFRARKIWREFRDKLIQVRGAQCQLCKTTYSGKRKSQLNLHHQHEDLFTYDFLEPGRFKLYCSSCHRYFIEPTVARYKKYPERFEDEEGKSVVALLRSLGELEYRGAGEDLSSVVLKKKKVKGKNKKWE